MQKNAITSLVIGLIIGGLAVWLLMGFTNLGSTMILNYSGTQKTEDQGSTVKTPTTSTGSSVVSGNEFTVNDLEIPNMTGKNGKQFSAKMNASGKKMTSAAGADTAVVTKVVITEISPGLAETANEFTGDTNTQITELGSDLQIDTNAIETFADKSSPNAQKAAENTAAAEMANYDGTDETSLTNREKAYDSADVAKKKIADATGASQVALDPSATFELGIELQNTLSQEQDNIELATWLGGGGAKIIKWCQDTWDEWKAAWR